MNTINILPCIKIKCLLKFCASVLLIACSRLLSGQPVEVATPPSEFNQRVAVVEQVVPQVVFQKINSRKSYSLLVGQKVWVVSRKSRNGRIGFKAAVITEIKDHQITFTPVSKQFEEYTVYDSALSYIEFANAGSVVRGIVVNAVLVSAVVVIVTFTVFDFLLSPFTGHEPMIFNPSGFNPINLPWDDFRKHIKIKTLRGKRKWRVEAMDMISLR